MSNPTKQPVDPGPSVYFNPLGDVHGEKKLPRKRDKRKVKYQEWNHV